MNVPDSIKLIQEEVLENLKKIDFRDPKWMKPFTTDLDPVTIHNIVIWYLKELVDKGEYVDEIFEIAKIYSVSEDPLIVDDINEKIERGEEIRNIYTVRGTVCWLLTSIAATLKTEHYTEIISILEKLTTDPVYYVRIQATVPLSFFARNLRAQKNKDGKKFNFSGNDRQRVIDISLKMLQNHRNIPRVLEGVTNVFEAFRAIDEARAKQVIDYSFFNSRGQIQPEYLTQKVIPLLLFYAEYRSENDPSFNGSWFQKLAVKLLEIPEIKAPYLRSTFIWHTWKEIQLNPNSYVKYKKYIPFFLHEDLEFQSLGQYDFLVKEVLRASPDDGVLLYQLELKHILKWVNKDNAMQHAWLLSADEIIEEIAKKAPNNLLGILEQLTEIVCRGVYISYLDRIFRSYQLVTDKEKGLSMREKILEMYSTIKKIDRFKKLPETI